MIYRQFIKAPLDRIVGLVLLLIISPLLVLIALILQIFQGGNPFFYQTRVGYLDKTFLVFKFKTMSDEKDQHGRLLSDEKRLTSIGKFIRKTSLDELPQLINIVIGDMSFVGPRPLLVEYLHLYSDEQRRRHTVIPGITGWAQVNGRNSISWKEKFAHDVWYVNHQSFWLDLWILILTVVKVFKAEGISGRGSATMEKFNGSN